MRYRVFNELLCWMIRDTQGCDPPYEGLAVIGVHKSVPNGREIVKDLLERLNGQPDRTDKTPL
jgi:hypothetical protein